MTSLSDKGVEVYSKSKIPFRGMTLQVKYFRIEDVRAAVKELKEELKLRLLKPFDSPTDGQFIDETVDEVFKAFLGEKLT